MKQVRERTAGNQWTSPTVRFNGYDIVKVSGWIDYGLSTVTIFNVKQTIVCFSHINAQ